MSLTRLVINADDLGLAASVNRGIIETIVNGVVTSTSLMVNMPAYEDAVRRLRDARLGGAELSVGLHFNIVTGQPLGRGGGGRGGDCGTLVDERTQRFLPLLTLAWKAVARRLVERDIQAELDAQLDRAESVLEPLGLRVTHIDSHRHAHCFPPVFDVVVRTARRRGIAHVRHPYEARTLLRRPRAIAASQFLRAVLSKREALDDVGFTGIGAMGSRTFDRDIDLLLAALPPGTTELMVHPGYDSPELAAIDPYRAPRERELRALTSLALRDRIRELGVELAPFAHSTARPA